MSPSAKLRIKESPSQAEMEPPRRRNQRAEVINPGKSNNLKAEIEHPKKSSLHRAWIESQETLPSLMLRQEPKKTPLTSVRDKFLTELRATRTFLSPTWLR